jgi:hypothetical protein
MDEAKPVANFPPLTDLKDCLLEDLLAHLEWMKDSRLFHGLDAGKIESWKQTTSQYFKWA